MNPLKTDKSVAFSLRISLLGPPQLMWQGAPQTTLLVKAQALLFYLALNPGPHSRAALAALLWSDMIEKKARGNLRTTLNRLRKPFGEYFITDRQSVAFNRDIPYWLDVKQFEIGLTDLSSARQRQAIDLYRGEFLADFYARGAPVFEEWALVQRERLRHLVLEGIAVLARQTGQQGDLGQAMADWRRLLALDPWRESAHRALMRLLARTGDRAAALAQFEECRRLLETELGVAPAPATAVLHEQIKDDAVTWWQGDKVTDVLDVQSSSYSGTTSFPHNLPTETTSFHGRSHELSQIQGTLQQPDCRLLTLMGLGGIGKSRLALEAARHMMGAGSSLVPDGVYWVSLTAVTARREIIPAIAAAIGFVFSGRADPEAQLSAYLSKKHLLLLLDNWEQLVAEALILTDLLQAAPGLKLLVTSRERLDLHEEWLLVLDGLPFPGSNQVDPATYDAVQLFMQRARRVNLNFNLDAELAGVLQICRLVEGMPLGLELAASWVQTFSCTHIASAMAENQNKLENRERNTLERHRSLQIAFEYSWQLLTQEEQTVLLRLAVFRGGFSWEAAERVVGATRRLLANLVGKSLVRRGRNGRFDMHEQLRQFAWQKGDKAGKQETKSTHKSFFATFMEERETTIKTSDQGEAIAAIKVDIENIRLAWNTAVANQSCELLEKMAGTLFQFYMKQGFQIEGVRVFGEAVEMLRQNGRIDAYAFHQGLLGRLLIFQGRCGEFTSQNFSEPQQVIEQGLAIARQQQQDEDIALALLGLGQLAIVSGESLQAEAYLQESVAICRSASLPWTLASALNLLAWTRNAQKLPTEAKELCTEAIAIQRDLGDMSGTAAALTTMGIIHSDLGEYVAAEKAYAKVLDICRQNEHLVGAAQALTGLFVASFQQGDYEKAAVYAQESLAVNQDAGDRLGMAIAYHNLGFLAASDHKHQQAVAQFHQALVVYQKIESNLLRSSNTRRHMADSLIALGELESAREQLVTALDTIPKQGWPSRGVEMLLSCANLFVELGEIGSAKGLLSFLHDNEAVSRSVRGQASDILAAGSFAQTSSRYQTLEEALIAARQYLRDS